MGESEHKVLDVRGKFLQVVKDGRTLSDAGWTKGRLLLSNRRLVLAGNEGKRTLPLPSLRLANDRFDVNKSIAATSDYLALRHDDDVILVAAADHGTFEQSLYGVLLDHEVLLVRHPAVAGGVVQDEVDWEKARLKVEENALTVAMADGTFVELDLDDIGSIDTGERTVYDEKRRVVEVEHSEDGTSVETYVSGEGRHCAHLLSFLKEGERRSEAELDLDEQEKRVLMALYSGVSPFQIADFVGMDVDRVEEIYDELIELEVLEEVRVRREVALTARGRNLASGAMNEE